ncbi:MAG: folate-binding protein YgfZ [Gammaproteobacteria bacterium]|nr:folate-binding protein YgfZ [Gammaproteobacteria bacterium]
MHNEWLNFLDTALKSSTDFPTTEFSENTCFLCPCEHLALIKVSGEDATSFLQNQVSNDIQNIDENTCQLNSYSSHKGRMFSIFNIIKINTDYLIILPKIQAEFLLQRLQMFVIMAKVTLTDVSDQWAKIGIQSETAANQFCDNSNQVTKKEKSIAVRLNPNSPNRVLLLLPAENAQNVWNELKEKIATYSSNIWQLAQIHEGIPSLTPETSEAFVLQMANLNLLDGVNFKKGCYPGQEIVARTRYLGKAKRRMYHLQVNSSQQPNPADELSSIKSDKADSSGKVVISAQSGEQQYDFLAVTKIDLMESNELKLHADPDAKLTIKKLPYSYED